MQRYCVLLFLVLVVARTVAGQQHDSTTTKVDISIPFELPIAFQISALGYKLDSVERVNNQKNRVRSVAKISLDKSRPDTVSYMEFDRQGNKSLDYNPAFRARTRMEYDQQNRCIRHIIYANPGYELGFETKYDTPSRTTTTEIILPDGRRELYQRTVQKQIGDTALTVANFYKTVYNSNNQFRKLVMRHYTYHQDTVLITTQAYSLDGPVIKSTTEYHIKRNGMRVEDGDVDYKPAIDKLILVDKRAQQLRSWLPTAAFYDTLTHQVKGVFNPKHLFIYDKKKQLLNEKYIAPARKQEPAEQEVYASAGAATASITSVSAEMRYKRNKAGQVLIQEYYKPNDPIFSVKPIKQEFIYSPKGLLLESKNIQVENLNEPNTLRERRYRYAYTFY
ncbi:hypothetical protein [Hymenobacter sp.]|jgi:hypothetical protein|uniref:hypothetical protein n=1 Tax=Hymenobacter sp. TaxID=1898978 RepID=UPI002ED7D6A3